MPAARAFAGDVVTSSIQVAVHFYDLEQNDWHQLTQEIALKGPTRPDGQRVAAYGRYQLSWQLDTQQLKNRCILKAAKVISRMDVTFPNWLTFEQKSPDVQRHWQRYIEAMTKYELKHKWILLNASGVIVQRFESQKPDIRCSRYRQQLDAIGRTVLDQVGQQMRDFRRSTQAGVSLGLRWPMIPKAKVHAL